jgi:hypothetical protein
MPDSNGLYHIQFLGDDHRTIQTLIAAGNLHKHPSVRLHAMPEFQPFERQTLDHYRRKDVLILFGVSDNAREIEYYFGEASRLARPDTRYLVLQGDGARNLEEVAQGFDADFVSQNVQGNQTARLCMQQVFNELPEAYRPLPVEKGIASPAC